MEVAGSQNVQKKDDHSQNNVDEKLIASDSGFENYIQIDKDGLELAKKKPGRRSQDANLIKKME